MRCPKTYRYVVSYCTGYIFASKVSKTNGMDENVSLTLMRYLYRHSDQRTSNDPRLSAEAMLHDGGTITVCACVTQDLMHVPGSWCREPRDCGDE